VEEAVAGEALSLTEARAALAISRTRLAKAQAGNARVSLTQPGAAKGRVAVAAGTAVGPAALRPCWHGPEVDETHPGDCEHRRSKSTHDYLLVTGAARNPTHPGLDHSEPDPHEDEHVVRNLPSTSKAFRAAEQCSEPFVGRRPERGPWSAPGTPGPSAGCGPPWRGPGCRGDQPLATESLAPAGLASAAVQGGLLLGPRA